MSSNEYPINLNDTSGLNKINLIRRISYKKGFNTHKELFKDKLLLSEEQLKEIIELARETEERYSESFKYTEDEIIKNYKHVEEWNVEFNEKLEIIIK
jgi:hypothetical protein